MRVATEKAERYLHQERGMGTALGHALRSGSCYFLVFLLDQITFVLANFILNEYSFLEASDVKPSGSVHTG